MPRKPLPSRPDSPDGPESSRAGAQRIESHMRFKPPIRRDTPMPGLRAPSTLPPPPFQHEAEVRGAEWWLDAHMSVVSSMSLLEQLRGGAKLRVPNADELANDLSELRDALYELYCDAADERMADATGDASPFSRYVKQLYASCEAILGAFIMVAAGARAGTAVEWAPLDEHAHLLADTSSDAAVTSALSSLQIDPRNPVEPLRNLAKDLASTRAAARTLADRISRLS